MSLNRHGVSSLPKKHKMKVIFDGMHPDQLSTKRRPDPKIYSAEETKAMRMVAIVHGPLAKEEPRRERPDEDT